MPQRSVAPLLLQLEMSRNNTFFLSLIYLFKNVKQGDALLVFLGCLENEDRRPHLKS